MAERRETFDCYFTSDLGDSYFQKTQECLDRLENMNQFPVVDGIREISVGSGIFHFRLTGFTVVCGEYLDPDIRFDIGSDEKCRYFIGEEENKGILLYPQNTKI